MRRVCSSSALAARAAARVTRCRAIGPMHAASSISRLLSNGGAKTAAAAVPYLRALIVAAALDATALDATAGAVASAVRRWLQSLS